MMPVPRLMLGLCSVSFDMYTEVAEEFGVDSLFVEELALREHECKMFLTFDPPISLTSNSLN